MKLKFILLLSVMFTAFLVKSQERVNAVLPSIDKKPIGTLSSAKGWLYNVDGQWISAQNKIPYPLEKSSSILQNFEKYGLGTDNFINIELRRIKIMDSSYLILIKKYRDGFYKYKSIEKGWINAVSYDFFVFSESHLETIKKSPFDTIINLEILNVQYGSLKYVINQNNYINDIERKIANYNLEGFNNQTNYLFLQIHRIAKSKIVRFNLNSDYIISYKTKGLFQSDEIFKKFYFEVTDNQFNNLFK